MSNVQAALKHAAKRLDEARDKIAQDMAMGYIKDYGDYKYSAGVARGYLVAKDILLEIYEQSQKDED